MDEEIYRIAGEAEAKINAGPGDYPCPIFDIIRGSIEQAVKSLTVRLAESEAREKELIEKMGETVRAVEIPLQERIRELEENESRYRKALEEIKANSMHEYEIGGTVYFLEGKPVCTWKNCVKCMAEEALADPAPRPVENWRDWHKGIKMSEEDLKPLRELDKEFRAGWAALHEAPSEGKPSEGKGV